MGVSNVIDTLELNIIVNNKGTTARINSTTNALKNLHKVISDINGAGGVDGTINGGGGSGSSSGGSGCGFGCWTWILIGAIVFEFLKWIAGMIY